MQDKYESCASTLAIERRGGRQRHDALVNELSNIVSSVEQAQADAAKWRDESEVRHDIMS